MGSGPGRLEIIASLTALAGLILCARGTWRLAASIRARFTYGAPYRRGTVQDRLLGLLLEIVVLLVGAALGFLALGQAEFQSDEVATRVGRVEAHKTEWGKVAVRIAPDPLYPGQRLLEAEVTGARWALAGEFITWDPEVKWLGFRNGHRLR
ncbi:MAG TPA: hypothetical protein VFT43_12555, partial [Candidatus Polarisedimenticolia bacterium]|nr:hypothetical protein [Candidatus Polarisedimenticolia bacterium]